MRHILLFHISGSDFLLLSAEILSGIRSDEFPFAWDFGNYRTIFLFFGSAMVTDRVQEPKISWLLAPALYLRPLTYHEIWLSAQHYKEILSAGISAHS